MIRSERLCAGYEGVEILHSVSLNIPLGKFTALIGPNGCGKTTFLKACAGILKPDSGIVCASGKDVQKLHPRDLAKILSYMPQSRPVPEMTVSQLAAHGRYAHLKWGRSLSESDRAIIHAAMETTDTLSLCDKRMDRLSGGERQRAYLAMMLAQQTPVMLLDEPTTYLDPKARFDMMDLLKALAAEGRTVLAVLHDISLALEYCDHIVLMDKGNIAAEGSPEMILSSGLLESVFGIRAEYGPGIRLVRK